MNDGSPSACIINFFLEFFVHERPVLKALRHFICLNQKHELMAPLSCQTVSSVHNGWLPPCRPFVVKFCTAQSSTVCTVPALHGPGDGDCVFCSLLTLSPRLLSLCKPIHPLFLSTFILSPSSVRPIMSPWERWSWPEQSIILQVQIWCVDITWPWAVQWSLSDQYKNVQLTSPVLLNSFNAITNHISTIVTLQGQGVILHDLL